MPATQLTVLDHRWAVIARGIGTLRVDLPIGIYKIEASLSRESWAGYVALNDRAETVRVPDFAIKSPVPFEGFTRSHASHATHLARANERSDLELGQGAKVVFMARNWSTDGGASQKPPRMRLERWRGDQIADLYEDGVLELQSDAVGTCAVKVHPGTYVVSVESAFGRFSQAVYACEGWATHVFVLQDFSSQRSEESSAAATPTVNVTQSIVREGEDRIRLYELLEVGQAALSDRRLALGRDVFNDIADGKWDSPILGLLAAHILLLAEDHEQTSRQSDAPVRFNRSLFEIILKNTAKLLGKTHPDILALRTRSKRMPVPKGTQVATPPLLKRSWDMLMVANETGYSKILPRSLWRRIRGNLNLEPYFTWTRADSVFAAQKRANERQLAQVLNQAQEMPDDDVVSRSGMTFKSLQLDEAASSERKRSKPNIFNLAEFAPHVDPNQLFAEDDTVEDELKRLARHVNIPYQVTESLLDHDAIRRILSRKRD